jgi:hypothetical protein
MGKEMTADKPAIVEVQYGGGKIILPGFRGRHRGAASWDIPPAVRCNPWQHGGWSYRKLTAKDKMTSRVSAL